jgi:Na+/H+-dicarboxylate symporter
MKRYVPALILAIVVGIILGWFARELPTLTCSDPSFHAHLTWTLDVECRK